MNQLEMAQNALMTKAEQKTLGLLLNDSAYEPFMRFMLDNQLLLAIDWKGEIEQGELNDFLTGRLTAFGIEFDVNDADIQQRLQKKIKKPIKTGDYIIKLIKEYQKLVSKKRFVIVNFCNGSDTYFIGIMRKTQLTKLKQETFFDNAYFIKFGEVKGNEALYIIFCQHPDRYNKNEICNAMNMWQLPIDSPPNEGNCQSCGVALFDEKGNPYFEMEMEIDII